MSTVKVCNMQNLRILYFFKIFCLLVVSILCLAVLFIIRPFPAPFAPLVGEIYPFGFIILAILLLALAVAMFIQGNVF